MTTLTGEFEVTSWDENTFPRARRRDEADADGTARFVGMQHVEGSIDGHDGGFVMETTGDFDGEKAVGTWSVIPASATGGLTGIRGEGRFEAPRGPKATYTLDVTLA